MCIRDRLGEFRHRLWKQLKDEGIGEDFLGFLSDLATVDDDGDAECLAQLCGSNGVYVTSSRAVMSAKRVAEDMRLATVDVFNTSQAKPGPAWNARLLDKLEPGSEKGASMSLQLVSLAMERVKERVHPSRTRREMISRPKL